MDVEKENIDSVIRQFFQIFNNKEPAKKDWTTIYTLCIPESIIVKKDGLEQAIYTVKEFIEPRITVLSNGTITGFEEHEMEEATIINRNIAQRFSRYQKSGYKEGQHFSAWGTKLFHFVKTGAGWKISSLTWEDD
ncbi:MAG: hypothetical protein JWP88_656 [Flaviaesturariibacter sp.]|nr:hypothetical protein [Flaviaesturariibacter sp.]